MFFIKLKKQAYLFKTFSASRIAEIQQTCKDMDIEWSHIPGTANISDILTREYLLPPNSLPWNTPSMKLYQNVTKIPASDISASQLPDSDLKNVVITNNALQVHDPGIGLVQLALYSEVSRQARQQCTKSGEISEQGKYDPASLILGRECTLVKMKFT